MRIEMYQDRSSAWRWRAVDANNRVVADGGEGYVARDAVERAIDNVVNAFRGAFPVVFRERRSKPRPDVGVGEPALYEIITVAEYQAEGDIPHDDE